MMRNKKILFSITGMMLILACGKNSPKINTTGPFVYTFMTTDIAFSLKFNESDTVYMKNYKGDRPEFYALLKNRDTLETLIRKIDFSKYDTLYTTQDKYSHITAIQFCKWANERKNEITIVGDGPEALYKTAIRFNELAKKLEFTPYNGKQDYGTFGEGMIPPPLPVPVQEAPKSTPKELRIK